MIPDVPLPWERLLWSGRPLRLWGPLRREEYCLTDFRLVRAVRKPADGGSDWSIDEIALTDIGEINVTESRLDRLMRTATVVVHATRRSLAPLVLSAIRHGPQLAAFLEVLSSEPHPTVDARAVSAALSWEPPPLPGGYREATGALVAVITAIAAVIVSLRGTTATVSYAPDDPISPNGVKRDRSEIVRFMESDVMPWARDTLGRIKGGPDRITCETCHGPHPETREWQMPAVAALPEPEVKERGWEIYSDTMDAQMRNAIYGYAAQSENQARAAYMRETVMPGMARLL
ncbi:MAG TPA: hypothetical protein VNZ26_33285, partial [Vicinamibacterales bacterium]|nr:hypothetical protein [Vicinamibacterales bacterium]